MATLNTTNIKHASSGSNNIVLASDGKVTFPQNTGNILQVVSTTKTDTVSQSIASQAVWSYTDSSLRVTITPTSASNKLLIFGYANVDVGNDSTFLYLQKDGTDLSGAMGDAASNRKRSVTNITGAGSGWNQIQHSFQFLDTAGNTSERYYNLAFSHGKNSSLTMWVNRSVNDTDAYYTARTASVITVMEIAA
tara:strand:- start:63 stop:641 length:579 start_codon:yes stop_codon:yes gene_type:complete